MDLTHGPEKDCNMETPETLDTIICRRILEMPEFKEMVDAEVRKLAKPLPEYFTREEIAKLWKVHPQTVSRMRENQIIKHGFEKTKVNGNVRFVRI